jgi:hypothetical protein
VKDVGEPHRRQVKVSLKMTDQAWTRNIPKTAGDRGDQTGKRADDSSLEMTLKMNIAPHLTSLVGLCENICMVVKCKRPNHIQVAKN